MLCSNAFPLGQEHLYDKFFVACRNKPHSARVVVVVATAVAGVVVVGIVVVGVAAAI